MCVDVWGCVGVCGGVLGCGCGVWGVGVWDCGGVECEGEVGGGGVEIVFNG